MLENPTRVSFAPEAAPTADRYIVTVGALLCLERVARSPIAGGCYQLLSVRHGAFRVMAAGERCATLCTAAIIPPHARYVLERCAAPMSRLFIDADSRAGRRLRDELAAARGSGPAPWIAVGERLIDSSFWNLLGPTAFATPIQRMLSNIERGSPELGLPLRAFTRWTRLHRFARLRTGGATLTEAARDAGFANRRVFLQTMQRHFGVSDGDFAPGHRWVSDG